MVVDIGGGTSEAAVVSMNDIVVWSSVRVGGNRIDQAIIGYVRKKYNLIIGEQTAEETENPDRLALSPLEDELRMDVRGRDQVTGLPKTIQVTSEEVTEAMPTRSAPSSPPCARRWRKPRPSWPPTLSTGAWCSPAAAPKLRNVDTPADPRDQACPASWPRTRSPAWPSAPAGRWKTWK